MGVQKREDESLGLAEPKLIQVEAYGGEAALSQLRDLVNQAIHSLASRLEVVERITIERSAEADLDNRIQKLDDTVSVLATKLEVAKKRWLDDSRRLWDAVDSHTHDVNEIEDGEEMQTLPAAVFRGHRPSDEDEAELNESQDPAQVSDRCDGEKFANMLLLQKELISSSKQAESVPESSSLPGSARVSQSPMPNFGRKTSPTSKSAQKPPGSVADVPPNILIGGNTAVRMIISPRNVQRSVSPAHPVPVQRSVSPAHPVPVQRSISPTHPILVRRSMSPARAVPVQRSISPIPKVAGLGTTTLLSSWSTPRGSLKSPALIGSTKLPGPFQAPVAATPAQLFSHVSTSPGRAHARPRASPRATPQASPEARPDASPQPLITPRGTPRGTPQASPEASPHGTPRGRAPKWEGAPPATLRWLLPPRA